MAVKILQAVLLLLSFIIMIYITKSAAVPVYQFLCNVTCAFCLIGI